MINMGSDHRCVMATFVITIPKKDGSRKTDKSKLETTKLDKRKQIDKRTGKEESEVEKRFQEIVEKSKKKLKPQMMNCGKAKKKPMKQKKAAAQAGRVKAEAEAKEANVELFEHRMLSDETTIAIEENDVGTTEQTDNTIKESTEDTAREASEEFREHHTQRDEVTSSIATRVGSDTDAAEQTENVIETDCLGEEIEMKSDEETVREADEELFEHRTQTDE